MNRLTKIQFERDASNDNVIVIDVLEEEFFNNEHIPGSINIPVDSFDFLEQVKQHADESQPIIVYSADKDCPAAGRAAQMLEEAGYTNISTFGGGMGEWKEKGGKLESNIPGAVDDSRGDSSEKSL